MKDIEKKIKFKKTVLEDLTKDLSTLKEALKVSKKWKPDAPLEVVVDVIEKEVAKIDSFISKYN